MDSYIASPTRYDESERIYRRSGKSGILLPKVSLGFWQNFGDSASYENCRTIARMAFDNGVTHFDLANNYGPPPGAAEIMFGRIMKDDFMPYRDEMIISTKAGYLMWPGPYGEWGSRKYLISSLDQSLKRMGLDYVDIFYHHRPDPDTPLYETMWALDRIVKSGKALYVGLSNYSGEQMEKAAAILADLHCPFVINQNRYSILDRGAERSGILNSAFAKKKGVIIFSPLAQGLLSGRYLGGIPTDSRVRTDGRFLKESSISPEMLDKITRLNAIAAERGQTLAQMALAWLYRREEITSVLIGASRPEQIIENLGMVENTVFTQDELDAIDAIVL